MLPRRLAACAVALAVLPAVPPVSAAVKKPCQHLIVDPRGDAMTGAPQTHDLVHADTALGRTELAAALTVAAGGPTSPAEVTSTWELSWTASGVRYTFTAARSAADNRWQSLVTVNGVRLAHVFTPAGSSLLWRVKRSDVKSLTRPKTVIRDATATSAILVQTDTGKQQGSWTLDGSCLKAK